MTDSGDRDFEERDFAPEIFDDEGLPKIFDDSPIVFALNFIRKNMKEQHWGGIYLSETRAYGIKRYANNAWYLCSASYDLIQLDKLPREPGDFGIKGNEKIRIKFGGDNGRKVDGVAKKGSFDRLFDAYLLNRR